MKKIPTWKLSIKDWDPEEFKTQANCLFDELNEVNSGGLADLQQYGWVQEKLEFSEEQAYLAYKKNNKDKLREKVAEMIVYEKKIALIERVSSMVENFQAQAKVLRKEKKCPEELTKDVAIVVYLADVFSIPSFQRIKHQLTFKYGEKYIEKICGKKHAGVDDELVAMATYSPDSKEVKARAKEVTEACKQREKDEEKAKKEAEKAKKSGKKSSSKKHRKDSSSDESSDDESSEEEKPKKKSKKSKKAESSSEDESSEEEKPKKKSKKAESSSEDESSEEEKPKKKSKKSKKEESSDSESEEEKPKEEPKKEEAKEEPKEEKPKEEPKKEEESSSDSD